MTSPIIPQALPPTSLLPSLSDPALSQILDLLFEPAPEIHAQSLPLIHQQHTTQGPFPNYETLIRAVGDSISALCASEDRRTTLHAILGSHPRLGAPKVHSAQSAAEQANLQAASEEQGRLLKDLNAEYEARFPGLRYVVFVNGRGRPEVMADMRARIDEGDIRAEERRAVAAMVDIALDRASKLDG